MSAVKLISSTIHVTATHILVSVAADRIPERQTDNMTSQSITSVMEEVTNSSLQFTRSSSNFFTMLRISYGMGAGNKKSVMIVTANVGENQMTNCI